MSSVTRTTRKVRAGRRDDIAVRLQASLEELLDDESFTEISVERLVRRAGISRSTFYVHFQDKGDLLQVLTEGVVDELIDAARGWWELPPSASKDEVREALGSIVLTYCRHEPLLIAVAETTTYDERVRARFTAMVRTAADGVALHIRAGQRQGFVHPELDPVRVGAWLTWMTERGLLMLVAGSDPAQAERLRAALVEIVWNTLYEGTR